MDKEVLEKLGGVITEVSMNVSRKVTDGNYGSFEVSMGETIHVGEASDVAEIERQLFKALKDKVTKAAVLDNSPTTIKDAPRDVAKEAVASKNAPSTIKDAPPPSDIPFLEEDVVEAVNIPIDDKGQEKIVFLVEKINVYAMPSGDKGAKAKGKMVNPGQNIAYHGNYMRHGVQVWPEVMAKEPLEWDLETMEIGEIDTPPGLTAICFTKEDEKGMLKPTKVEEWK